MTLPLASSPPEGPPLRALVSDEFGRQGKPQTLNRATICCRSVASLASSSLVRVV